MSNPRSKNSTEPVSLDELKRRASPAAQDPTARGGQSFASVVDDEQLEAEVQRRRKSINFPLHVFPSEISPLLVALEHKMEGERGFIGLSLLQVVAAAIGTALRVTTGNWETSAALWGCCVGISSGGKSMIQSILMKPLNELQERFHQQDLDQRQAQPEQKTPLKLIHYQDYTFQALVRDVLQHNYKGVMRYNDELLKWLDDMDSYKSGKSEESFWTASWAATSSFVMGRVDNNFVIVPKNRLASSIMGSTQPGILHRFYAQGRLETGFIYRMLFALAHTDKVISPDLFYRIPEETLQTYVRIIQAIYEDLPMNSPEAQPRVLLLEPQAVGQLQAWQNSAAVSINAMTNQKDKEVKAGIYGKIKEYALRFALLLKVLHASAQGESLPALRRIESDYMTLALSLCDYFLHTGYEAYQIAKGRVVIPAHALEFAGMFRACQYNQSRLAQQLGVSRQAVSRKFIDYSERYPSLFGSRNA